jgi:hypothetical protein
MVAFLTTVSSPTMPLKTLAAAMAALTIISGCAGTEANPEDVCEAATIHASECLEVDPADATPATCDPDEAQTILDSSCEEISSTGKADGAVASWLCENAGVLCEPAPEEPPSTLTGNLIGRVLTASGEPFPDVAVSAMSPAAVRRGSADEAGWFSFDTPPGYYEVRATVEVWGCLESVYTEVGEDQTRIDVQFMDPDCDF